MASLLFLFIFLIYIGYASAEKGLLKEFCLTESFTPQCQADEVVSMDTAHYGRMAIGRCIDGDYGYLGCTSDQLSNLDRKCSGLPRCEVWVTDASMIESMNCSIPKSFTRYLEARYSCQKVYQPSTAECTSPYTVPLTSSTIQLASSTTAATSCGQEGKHWVLEAKPGQKINISLTDFHWNDQQPLSVAKCPVRYGYIIDVDMNEVVGICGGSGKYRHVYLSEGSTLQVSLDSRFTQQTRFMLSVEVKGCPTYEAPANTWTTVDGSVVTVGCTNLERTWKMRCIGSHWIGITRDCTAERKEGRIKNLENTAEKTVLGMTPVVAYTIIGGVFIIIVSVLVTTALGYFCIRKTKSGNIKNCYLAPVLTRGNHDSVAGYPTLLRGGNDQLQTGTLLVNGNLLPYSQQVGTMSGASTGPQYFLLENTPPGGQKEPIYDEAVYQNVTDVNSS